MLTNISISFSQQCTCIFASVKNPNEYDVFAIKPCCFNVQFKTCPFQRQKRVEWTIEALLLHSHQQEDIGVEAQNEKYLGVPVYMGRLKEKTFNYLKDQVWKRIQGWKQKLLSQAGKEILIKAVAQAIPSYAMSCFDLTKTLCDAISTMIC